MKQVIIIILSFKKLEMLLSTGSPSAGWVCHLWKCLCSSPTSLSHRTPPATNHRGASESYIGTKTSDALPGHVSSSAAIQFKWISLVFFVKIVIKKQAVSIMFWAIVCSIAENIQHTVGNTDIRVLPLLHSAWLQSSAQQHVASHRKSFSAAKGRKPFNCFWQTLLAPL